MDLGNTALICLRRQLASKLAHIGFRGAEYRCTQEGDVHFNIGTVENEYGDVDNEDKMVAAGGTATPIFPLEDEESPILEPEIKAEPVSSSGDEDEQIAPPPPSSPAPLPPAPKRRRLRGKRPPRAQPELDDGADADEEQEAPPPLEPEPDEPASKRRRVTRDKLCRGHDGIACTFSTVEAGAPARVQPGRKQTHCCFCSVEQLDRQLADKNGGVLKHLSALLDMNYQIFDRAIARIKDIKDEATAEDFGGRVYDRVTKAVLKPDRGNQLQQDIAEFGACPKIRAWKKAQKTWQGQLEHRRRAHGSLRKKEQTAYEETVRRDRATVRRKILMPECKRKHITAESAAQEVAAMPLAPDDVGLNDTGLPPPEGGEDRQYVEWWCKIGSWKICETCHSVRPVPLRPLDARRVGPPTVKSCSACKPGATHYVPQPEDVPEPLRDLNQEIVAALRPLDIDTGRHEVRRFGYRVHSSMVSFAWAAKTPTEKIASLSKRKFRKRAKKAYEYLMDQEEDYASFVERQRVFLHRHPDAAEKKRKRPLRFLEEEGIEAAL